MTALLWKEWRENRLLLLGILAVSSCLVPLLRLLGVLMDPQEDWLAGQIMVVVMAACFGGNMVAQEAGRGTLELLWVRPIARWRVWAAKAIFGLVATMFLGLALNLTVLAGSVWPQDLPEELLLAWPFEAALAFSGGFFVSGMVQSGLGAGLAGTVVGAVAGTAILVLPLRLTVFWPAAVVSLLLGSWFTFSSAIGLRPRQRRLRIAAGVAVAILLMPATYLAAGFTADRFGPGSIISLDVSARLHGSRRVIVAASTWPSPIEPSRGPESAPWADKEETRLAELDLDTGQLSWLPPRHVSDWTIAYSGDQLVGTSRDFRSGRPYSLWLQDLGPERRFEHLSSRANYFWGWYRPVVGVTPEKQIVGLSGRLGNGLEPRLRYGPLAQARPDETVLDSTGLLRPDRIDRACSLPESSRVLVEFGNPDSYGSGGHRREVRSSPGTWVIDVDQGTIDRFIPRDSAGGCLQEAVLKDWPGEEAIGSLAFIVPGKGFGLCRYDGSNARLIQLPESSPERWSRYASIHPVWNDDRTYLVLEGTLQSSDEWKSKKGSWLVSADQSRGWRLRRPPPVEGWNQVVSVFDSGAYFLRTRRDGSGGTLWWSGTDGAPAEQIYATKGRVHYRTCDTHLATHPFALEWLPADEPAESKGSMQAYSSSHQGAPACRFPDYRNMPSGTWRLLVLRPPDRGGVLAIPLPKTGPRRTPRLVMNGSRALISQAPDWNVSIIDARDAVPFLRPFQGLKAPLSYNRWLQWVGPDRALLASSLDLQTLDTRTMTARRILQAK